MFIIIFGSGAVALFIANSENLTFSDEFKNMAKEIFVLLILGIFGLIGLMMMLYPIINRRKKLKYCKCLVKATIIDFKRSYGPEGGTSYHPVYEFCYKGEIYRVTNPMATLLTDPNIGTQVDIFINEDNPYDFYAQVKSTELFFIYLGFLFVSGISTCIFSILTS